MKRDLALRGFFWHRPMERQMLCRPLCQACIRDCLETKRKWLCATKKQDDLNKTSGGGKTNGMFWGKWVSPYGLCGEVAGKIFLKCCVPAVHLEKELLLKRKKRGCCVHLYEQNLNNAKDK